MTTPTWKGNWLLIVTSALTAALLATTVISLVKLPLLGDPGLVFWLILLLLTLAASRFTVSITTTDGLSRTRKSVADAFIFLAVMLYAVPPTETAAPATLLAAIVGLVSSYGLSTRREVIFTTAITTVSTFISASCYGILVELFAGRAAVAVDQGLPLNISLIPICVLAVLQYSFTTLAMAAFLSIDAGKAYVFPSQESIVWTLTTQVAGAASAVLFYSSFRGAGIPFALLGVLVMALVHLLYRFNEKRLNEVREAEAEKRHYIQEIANIHMNTIESLAIAIDAKDQSTHGHVRRTQIYAQEMGRLLNVSDSELQALFAGALLHDIGKLAVPEYILNKPGKLTEAEFAKMKIHPIVGGDILKRVNFPYPVEDIVRYHHEKWDGGGYPTGLKGKAIPLVARIIAVVDFYDATRCDRPYRKGMTREDSLALLKSMAGTAFDPSVVEVFVAHVERFDQLIASEDIREQVASNSPVADFRTSTKPDAGLAADGLGTPSDSTAFNAISEAQREVFALHEIAKTVGSSLNLNDTVVLVTNKLRTIVPFETCIIFVVEERTGKAVAVHATGEHAELFEQRRINVGDGITGWVVANSRTMCNASPDLDLGGIPEEISKTYRSVLASPLLREDGAFGSITLYSKTRDSYMTEHVRLLESVCQHASNAINNALTFERTKASALTDPLTELPNARGFYMMLEQRIAECQRMNRESLAVLCLDIDDFKIINDEYGHSIGDRILASVAGVIRAELRQMDALTRYAGDEFVAIMPMASSSMAAAVGKRIRTAVESHKFSVRTAKTVQLGISVGVACFPEDGDTTEELLTVSISRMQREKHGRKTMLTLAKTPVSLIETLR